MITKFSRFGFALALALALTAAAPTTTHRATILLFNVQDYGAIGDGTADDTAAVTAAISAIPSAGGVLYFPLGTYKTSGGFTLSKPIAVRGDGMTTTSNVTPDFSTQPTTFPSQVKCSSATAVLFTVTSAGCSFERIALTNSAGSTPSAGSAIYVQSHGSMMRVRDVFVSGFYDDIDWAEGYSWSIANSFIYAPVRYGLRVRNTSNADAGDQSIVDVSFFARTYSSTAAIRYESGGGLKLVNVKINVGNDSHMFQHGIDATIATGAATGDFFIANSSIENYSGNGIQFVSGTGSFGKIHVVGCEFLNGTGNTTGHAVFTDGTSNPITNAIVSACTFQAPGGTSSAAVLFTNTTSPSLSLCQKIGFASMVSLSGSSVLSTEIPQATATGPAVADGSMQYVMRLRDDRAFAAGIGGGLEFTGAYNTAGDIAGFSGIQGFKENGTDGNYAGAMGFFTRVNGGSPTERMRVASTGGISIGTTSDPGANNVLVHGVIEAGSSPTTLTDSSGKILSAALNTVAVAQGGSGGTDAATARTNFQISDAGNVKVYRAMLSQSSTSAPVATVMENSLGGTLTWARTSAGLYTATLSGAFSGGASKVWLSVGGQVVDAIAAGQPNYTLVRTDNNTLTLVSGVADDADHDDLIAGLPIEVRVYP